MDHFAWKEAPRRCLCPSVCLFPSSPHNPPSVSSVRDSVVGTERESPFWWLYKGHIPERKIFTAESLNFTASMQCLFLNQLIIIVH